jgi:hypothetical protein
MDIDLTTATGIALIVSALTQIIKIIYNKYLIEKAKGLVTLTTILVLSQLLSLIAFQSQLIPNDTAYNCVHRGIEAFLISVGGYEGIKQLLQAFIPTKDI